MKLPRLSRSTPLSSRPRSRPAPPRGATSRAVAGLGFKGLPTLLALAGHCFAPAVAAQTAAPTDTGCGSPFANGAYVPYDYRVVQGAQRQVVESNHFTWNIESLVRGNTGSLGAELSFTLRAFPNHHRALVSMMNLGAKLKTQVPPGAAYSVECFFIRALTFRPDDVVARMIYAKYLVSNGRKADAAKQLEITDFHAKDNGFTHYNIGLIYLDLHDFDNALAQSHQALALGFSKAELQDRLQAAGKWREPAPVAASASAPASAPAASAAAEAGSAPAN